MSDTDIKPFDLVGFIMDFEGDCDDMTDERLIEGFQHLIDTGTAWQLQGFYGRMAEQLIADGRCTDSRPKREAKPELIGTFCECGAPYNPELPGYNCAR